MNGPEAVASPGGGLVLIVEDEPKLASIMADYLLQSGFTTHCIDHGEEVLPFLREHTPELVLLDVMLPGRDGIDIFREMRSFSRVPVIFVTARVDEIDRLLGLELGADDYVCKPFSPRELVARVKAVLRRAAGSSAPDPGIFRIDPHLRRVEIHGKAVEMTQVEFEILRILGEHPGWIYSRTQLMDRIYEDRRIVSDRTIDSHIKKIRKKISAVAPGLDVIQSVYGVGYRLGLPD
jgi:two-component system response regulator BaeR